jgi:predicted nucleic acid-binding protein
MRRKLKLRVYCDTNIYLDFFLGRRDYLRPLDEFAYQIFRRVEEGEFSLIISDHLLYELENNLEDTNKITELLQPLSKKGRIVKVFKSKDDVLKAKEISKEHWKDALHAILANKAKAVYLLTRNIPDYAGCEHLVEIKFPESI